jgi:alkylmercury lyase
MADFVEEVEQFLASFSPEEVAVSRYAFRAILAGAAATLGELPAALGLPPAVVDRVVAGLTERGTVALEADPDRIVGVRGLSLVETDHRLTLQGRRLYTWCAVDAVGIPAALEADARVESRCHHCRAPLSLALKEGALGDAPEGPVIWAVERDLGRSLRAHT